LAEETANAGVQSQAAGLPVVPPGWDLVSANNAVLIQTYTSLIAGHLQVGAQMQHAYGQSINGSAHAYTIIDELNAAGAGFGQPA
jgi:hypothetical protein